ncbi:MAG: hypothetical protein Q9168_006498 [Polycauliona sp. 1 TL-2023]
MAELRVHTQIHSRYQVFDAAGGLPFGIVFSLCRRSPADTDPRPLLLNIAGSVLDVPYALAHGLLTINRLEDNAKDDEHPTNLDLSRLTKTLATEPRYLSLPSPVNRVEHWRDSFTVYRCPIGVDGELASILEPGRKYRIKLASSDLGIRRWAYSDQQQLASDDETPNHGVEAVILVSSKPSAGNATFTVVKSLPWPPRIETTMRLCKSASNHDLDTTETESNTALEVSVTNTGPDSVTVQTRGHQRFLVPWGPFQPEPDANDDRVRILDSQPHISDLQVIDAASEGVIRKKEKDGVCSLKGSQTDRRPKVEHVVVLKPRVPLVKRFDVKDILNGLADGQYKIRLQPRGCRWWHGEIGEEECEDGRIPEKSGDVTIPPLMLESRDTVELRVKDQQVDH